MQSASSPSALPPTPDGFAELQRRLVYKQNALMRCPANSDRRDTDCDDSTLVQLVKDAFPDPEHRKMYRTWVKDKFRQRQVAQLNKAANPASNYFALVANTDFFGEKSLNRLIALFSRTTYSYIGIGSYHNHQYRLKPMTELLEPDDECTLDSNTLPLALDPLIGIEIQKDSSKFTDAGKDAQFKRRERPFSNRQTDDLYRNASDLDWARGDDSEGFAFLPLGEVWSISDSAWDYEKRKTTPTEDCKMKWNNTGFILGVTTNRTEDGKPGTAGEVWLLYNFTYNDPMGGQWEIGADDIVWGLLERENGDGVRRGGFKIADDFGQLMDGFQWDIEKFFDEKYRLSPARVFQDDTQGSVIVREDAYNRSRRDSKPPVSSWSFS